MKISGGVLYMSNYPEYHYYRMKEECRQRPVAFPPQMQENQPGLEYLVDPPPIFDNLNYKSAGKLKGKAAIITGGDSGIGRAVAVLFAKEGANVTINFLASEIKDALETQRYIDNLEGRCLLVEGDIRDTDVQAAIVNKTVEAYGGIDILVNNCGVQFPQASILDISYEQMLYTYEVNVFSFFMLTKACLIHMQAGASIINTTSIAAYEGQKELIDFSSTKGAIVSFTRSLALSLADRRIRVNAVAPGSFWTPLPPASWRSEEKITTFGTGTPMGRAGQPFEIAPAYLYLACDDSNYMTGEVMHVNGGKYISS